MYQEKVWKAIIYLCIYISSNMYIPNLHHWVTTRKQPKVHRNLPRVAIERGVSVGGHMPLAFVR